MLSRVISTTGASADSVGAGGQWISKEMTTPVPFPGINRGWNSSEFYNDLWEKDVKRVTCPPKRAGHAKIAVQSVVVVARLEGVAFPQPSRPPPCQAVLALAAALLELSRRRA